MPVLQVLNRQSLHYMEYILFDDISFHENLKPFTLTRPVGALRVGILTIAEKWEQQVGVKTGFHTVPHLQEKFVHATSDDAFYINGGLCPDENLHTAIQRLEKGKGLKKEDQLLAYRGSVLDPAEALANSSNYEGEVTLISQCWNIFQYNGAQIKADFAQLTKGRKSAKLEDPFTKVYGEENLFIEEGTEIRAAIIDAAAGPVYIGKNAHVHEGAIIKGPFALGEGAHINMGAKIKGDTTVGPYSKVGGEVSNSVILGYSNKGHDGFLGNSVLGEWCNLGADTNTSNLKNNYASVKLWNYKKGGFVNTGQQFCGLMMGDHSKCGINTMFNTGTVVGVSANIFGSGFPRNFIPSFAWGGASGFSTFQLPKAFEVAEKVMSRRKKTLDDAEKNLLTHIFKHSADERIWEK